MIILGIGGILGDAATAILKDGELAAAVEESKLSRFARPGELPERSIAACLALAGAKAGQVDCVALVRPISAGAETHLRLRTLFPAARVLLIEHHPAHAASAYYASGFEEATVLTLDRAGDFRCGARFSARGNSLVLERESHTPDSLGDLYGRVTELLGFASSSEEHKVQWLSVSGDDRYRELFLEIMPPHNDGWPRLDRSFFDADRLKQGGFSARFFSRLGRSEERRGGEECI